MSKKKKSATKKADQTTVTTEVTTAEADVSQTTYEEELSWCILMCQCYLKKPDDDRVTKSLSSCLKTLQSTSSSLVKKRQSMRINFGDYRKKIVDERKLTAKKCKVEIKKVSNKDYLKKTSTILRKANPPKDKETSTPFMFNFISNE